MFDNTYNGIIITRNKSQLNWMTLSKAQPKIVSFTNIILYSLSIYLSPYLFSLSLSLSLSFSLSLSLSLYLSLSIYLSLSLSPPSLSLSNRSLPYQRPESCYIIVISNIIFLAYGGECYSQIRDDDVVAGYFTDVGDAEVSALDSLSILWPVSLQ